MILLIELLCLNSLSFAIEINDLNNLSARQLISNLFEEVDYSSSYPLLLQFPTDQEYLQLLSTYLHSTNHLAFIQLLNRISENCPSSQIKDSHCPEKEELLSAYIKHELALLRNLSPFLNAARKVDNIHNLQEEHIPSTAIVQNIFIFLNIICLPISIAILLSNLTRLSVVSCFFSILFFLSFITAYGQKYQENIAKRISTIYPDDPCRPNSWVEQLLEKVESFFIIKDKTNCQNYIALNTVPAWLDVSPSLVFVEVVSNFLFGWIGPLGGHLNVFYKRIAADIPIVHLSLFFFSLALICFIAFFIKSSFKYRNGQSESSRKPEKDSEVVTNMIAIRGKNRKSSKSRSKSNSRSRKAHSMTALL